METADTAIPDVTVSIVNHRNRDEVLACLASILETPSQKLSIEIVVLDNASDDGSVEAIREAFPQVRVIAQTHRAGFGANHNRVIASTQSRYVFVLNDDTQVGAEALEALVEYLDAHPRVAVAGPKILRPGDAQLPSAWRFPSPARCAVFALTFGTVGIVQSGGSVSRRVDWVSGSAMMVRRSALEEVGPFDDQIYMYMEETDLCRRLVDTGHEIHYVPGTAIFHEGWGSTGSIPERRTNELWRSRRYYWSKHHSVGGAQAARLFDAFRYGVGAVGARIALAAGLGSRGLRVQPDDARLYGLNARNAIRGVRGVGIREMATSYNGAANGAARSAPDAELASESTQAGPWEARRPWAGLAKAALTATQASLSSITGSAPERGGNGLRILCYHRVSPDRDQLALAPERFRSQLELIAQSDFEVIDLGSHDLDHAFERPQLAITFDDGYRDFAEHALPELERVGFPAAVFIVPEAVERRLDFPWYGGGTHPPLLGWDEMAEIEKRAPIRFEPHGMTHPRLPHVSLDRARWEIEESKRVVEERLGRPARLFCYPGGYYGARERQLVEKAGFVAAVTCEYGLNTSPTQRYELRRTLIDRYDSRWVFAARLGSRVDRAPAGRRTRAG